MTLHLTPEQRDSLKRYPYILPQPTAFDGAKVGFALGFVVGLGAALIVFVGTILAAGWMS